MTATLWPFGAGAWGCPSACSRCQSATKRSRRPMPTGSPLMPRTHLPSHWVSCGQTRPQTAGSEEDAVMHLISALEILVGDALDKRGDVDTAPGRPLTQGFVLAVEAALGLAPRPCSVGIAEGDLVEVLVADVGLLRRHRAFFRVHIAHNGHTHLTSFLNRLQVLFAGVPLKVAVHRAALHGLVEIDLDGRRNPGRPRRRTSSSPPTVRRQPPHMPVPSIIMGFMETTVLIAVFLRQRRRRISSSSAGRWR